MNVGMGTIPDWLTFLATAAAVVVAALALNSWKMQLEGGTKHSVRHEIEIAALGLWYAFYAARNPFFGSAEFGETYKGRRFGEKPTREEEAIEYWNALMGRLKELWPYLRTCLDLRPKAGSVFGYGCAKALEELASKASELRFIAEEYVEQIRVGPEIVKMWTDQNWVERVKASVTAADDKADPLSLEFEAEMKKVFESIGRVYAPPG